MGADYILHRECDVKLALGQGDPTEGTTRLLGMLKAQSRGHAVAQMLEQQGQDPAVATITMRVMGPDGPVDRQVTAAEMSAEAAPLADLEGHCKDCDACVMSPAFGCVGYLNYPLTDRLEHWLIERIQPVDSLGGDLLMGAIADFGYDGSAMADWRQRPELVERSKALSKVVAKKLLRKTTVSTDQLFQAILQVGPLNPSHCMGVLLWFGCLEVNGTVPQAIEAAPLIALTEARTPAARQQVGAFDAGPPHDDAMIRGFQQLLSAMYWSWVLAVPLLVDA